MYLLVSVIGLVTASATSTPSPDIPSFIATTESPESLTQTHAVSPGNNWMTTQLEVFSEMAGAWYNAPTDDLTVAFEMASNSVTNDRDLNTLSNMLMGLRDQFSSFCDINSLLIALDYRLNSLGIDAPVLRDNTEVRLARLTRTSAEREKGMKGAHWELPSEEVSLYNDLLTRALAEADRIGFEQGLDVRSVYLPFQALYRFYWATDVGKQSTEQRMERLSIIGSWIANPDHATRAVRRANMLLDPQRSWIVSSIYGTLLGAVGSLRSRPALEPFLERTLSLIEDWSSSPFLNIPVCTKVIIEITERLLSLNTYLRYVGYDEPAFLEELGGAIPEAQEELWASACGENAEFIPTKSPMESSRKTPGLVRLDFLFRKLLAIQRGRYDRFGLLPLSAILEDVDSEERHPDPRDAVRAVIEGIQRDVQHADIKDVQVDALIAVIEKVVVDVANDSYAGLIEGAYQLGTFGIRLLQFTTIDGVVEERMRFIRRIVSNWLFCAPSVAVRRNMIILIRESTDEELERIARAWFWITRAFHQFKGESDVGSAIMGFLPNSVLGNPTIRGLGLLAVLERVASDGNDQIRSIPDIVRFVPSLNLDVGRVVSDFLHDEFVRVAQPILAHVFVNKFVPTLRQLISKTGFARIFFGLHGLVLSAVHREQSADRAVVKLAEDTGLMFLRSMEHVASRDLYYYIRLFSQFERVMEKIALSTDQSRSGEIQSELVAIQGALAVVISGKPLLQSHIPHIA